MNSFKQILSEAIVNAGAYYFTKSYGGVAILRQRTQRGPIIHVKFDKEVLQFKNHLSAAKKRNTARFVSSNYEIRVDGQFVYIGSDRSKTEAKIPKADIDNIVNWL